MNFALITRNRTRVSLLFLMVALGAGCGDDASTATDAGQDAGDDSQAGTHGGGGQGGEGGGAGTSSKDAGPGAEDKDAGPEVDDDASVPVDPEGDTYGVTSEKRLVFFERATGGVESAEDITGLAVGEIILGADIRPSDGKLYVLTSMARLHTVDLSSGATTLKSTLSADAGDSTSPYAGLTGARFGVDWNPVADRLRVVGNGGQSLRINADSGATTTDGTLNPGTPDVTAAAYTNSFAAACRTQLFVIDATTGNLLLQDPPNNGTLAAIGSLGSLDYDAISSFEIVTASDGTQHAVLAIEKDDATQLLTVSLTTGAATASRDLELDTDETLIALSAAPPAIAPAQSSGELLGLTVSNRVVSFNRSAPGKLCTSAEITGLGSSEQVLGIDVRPAGGAVYALGSLGKLYTLNVTTGAAALQATLAADLADSSDPFTALSGTEFAVGFNPVPDRLRVVSDNGQSLRINVMTGATTTDSALSGAATGVTAGAYTNAFAGAKSTTLYALDTMAENLVRIGGSPATAGSCSGAPDADNPNCGVVTSVGSLGLTGNVSDVNGFDIDGKLGTALAALAIDAAVSSTLYSIDLATGAATLPTGVANGTIGGGERLRGLTLAANPTLTAYGLTSDEKVVVFSVTTPNAPSATLTVSGLQASEDLLGVDFRPADGKLYALGSSGRLYTLNTTTGAATQVVVLQDAAGDSDPFSSLAVSDFGIDFNPVADLLRAVDATGTNLRIAPSARSATLAGDTFTDATLNPSGSTITAAAYTNSLAGATTTTLYVLDTTSDTLYIQAPPNDGTLSGVGSLGVDATSNVGLDIVGGHNGLALAAIRTTGAQSELYSVQLTSGTATAFNASNNTIGSSTANELVGLALELK